MTRPASPLPRTRLRSTSRSSAAFRAAGVERVRSLLARLLDPAFPRASLIVAADGSDSPSAGPQRCRVLDDAQHIADLHVVAILAADLEDASLRGRDLEVNFVRLELDERVADRHGVPFLAEPLRHARVHDGLADFRDDYVRRHAKSSVCGLRSRVFGLWSSSWVSDPESRVPSPDTRRVYPFEPVRAASRWALSAVRLPVSGGTPKAWSTSAC